MRAILRSTLSASATPGAAWKVWMSFARCASETMHSNCSGNIRCRNAFACIASVEVRTSSTTARKSHGEASSEPRSRPGKAFSRLNSPARKRRPASRCAFPAAKLATPPASRAASSSGGTATGAASMPRIEEMCSRFFAPPVSASGSSST